MTNLEIRLWDSVTNKMIYHDNCGDKSLMICLGGSVFQKTEKFHRFTLMMWTGLIDKTGKKIFEGDVLSNRLKNGVVQWNEKYCAWFCSDIHQMLGDGVYEVIGNIYKNPELL